jgi:hypothetical protein
MHENMQSLTQRPMVWVPVPGRTARSGVSYQCRRIQRSAKVMIKARTATGASGREIRHTGNSDEAVRLHKPALDQVTRRFRNRKVICIHRSHGKIMPPFLEEGMVEGDVGHRSPCGFRRGLDHFQNVPRLRAGIALTHAAPRRPVRAPVRRTRRRHYPPWCQLNRARWASEIEPGVPRQRS